MLFRSNKACIRKQMPMVIYEMQMGSFIQEDTIFPNYREVADDLVVYLRDMKYTHVQLMPITEYPLDESLGYQTTGYYSVTSRYGKPDDFKYFIDTMHLNGIGVILEWVPTHFPRDSWSLAQYDGTSLYEHCDDRRGITSDGNNLIFQYNRPMVRNFLIGSALFWLEHYHLDGLKINGLDSMLYLDFDRCQGEWVPNIYGGNENIEAMAFLSELTSIIHTKHPEKLIIAESTSCFPNMEELGIDLGLDFICNTGWKQDFCDYIQRCDESRTQNHSMLTRSAVYKYTDDFILALDYRDVTFGKKTFINKVPGRYEDKFANMRVA